MKYLILAIVNTIYGILLLSTLSLDTPGFSLVLIIGGVLTIMGLAGFYFWIKMAAKDNDDLLSDQTAVKSWFSLAKSFDIVLVIGLLFKALILQPFIVEGSSMEPSFHDKEIMLVDKISYRFSKPERGDVLIFRSPKNPNEDYIKRVIALPGDTIAITKSKVYINGSLLKENYLFFGQVTDNETSMLVFNQTLKSDEYFVMGDNRSNSSDSRTWGVMPKSNIIGRAWFNIYPLAYFGLIEHSVPMIDNSQLMQN